MPTKTCNICNLTLDISEFKKNHAKCKKCYKKHTTCKHDKIIYHCHECNPKNICKHDKQKRSCQECSPHRFCKHNIQKYSCPECNPKILCEHGTRKQYCPECSPQNLCEHDILKYSCPECNHKLLCEHNIRKHNCLECNHKLLCEHGFRKYHCCKCNPKNLCVHGHWKQHCPKCDGSQLCIHCKYIIGTLRYVESLDKKIRCCSRCFYNFYPNDEIPRRYKLKQHYFNEKLIEEFGDIFEYDKVIKCGCSKRRPDWFIDCYKYSIIIELDEDQHKYESCDEKRMMELFQDLGNRPLVLIRINPDKYKGRTKKRKGCFDFDEKNILICNEKRFNKRFNILVEMIKYFIDNEPEKEFTMEKLFFDRN